MLEAKIKKIPECQFFFSLVGHILSSSEESWTKEYSECRLNVTYPWLQVVRKAPDCLTTGFYWTVTLIWFIFTERIIVLRDTISMDTWGIYQLVGRSKPCTVLRTIIVYIIWLPCVPHLLWYLSTISINPGPHVIIIVEIPCSRPEILAWFRGWNS